MEQTHDKLDGVSSICDSEAKTTATSHHASTRTSRLSWVPQRIPVRSNARKQRRQLLFNQLFNVLTRNLKKMHRDVGALR